MVATPIKTEKRLTIQTEEINNSTRTIRSLDWDRDRFDIEFGLQNGTTYNSYIIQGDKIALVDTSHAKFRELYLTTLTRHVDPTTIDYIIISHTEPDHSGLVKDVLAIAPQAVVVGAKVAIKFLKDLVHEPFEYLEVKSGDRLDLGQGHNLEFVSAPNLHWPDTIFTYDPATTTLFTCDAFGMHYCSKATYDDNLKAIEPDYRFYYECLMAPNARSVLSAMKRVDQLDGEVTLVANGHGPLLKHNTKEMMEWYRQWSEAQTKGDKMAAVFYISDYGYSDRISQAIAKGITKAGVAVEMVDLKVADPQDVHEIVCRASGLVLGMPPMNSAYNDELSKALGTIIAASNNKQAFGMFESYGGNDEPVDTLLTKFRDVGLTQAFNSIRVREEPSENLYQICEESGTDLGQLLTQKDKLKERKALDSELDKAMGRISGGLYILTAQKGDVKGAMVASWVTQASFDPPGFTVAIAKDRAIESIMQVGDRFVLNILEEGNYQSLMKHFLKRFPPGADRFDGVNVQTAKNGSPILGEALAYLECEVISRMDCSDHWIVYSQVDAGRVSNPDALTAVHHRKVGNYY